MKKLTSIMALAVAAVMTSCTGHSPKANLETNIDTLSYAMGMARTEGLAQFLMQQGIDSTYMDEFLQGFNEGASKISKKDIARVTGMQIGQMVSGRWVEAFNQQLFEGDSTQTLSRQNFLAGFVDGVKNKKNIMDKFYAEGYTRKTSEAIREESLKKKYADVIAEGEKFLAENKTKEGVVTTESGLQYKVIKQGNGAIPADSNRVQVHYRGTLLDGTEFDSSYKNKKPASLMVKQVIKGWQEALQLMPVGSKWELYVPYDLAYGSHAASSKIKPFSTLIFEVELLGIEKDK